MDAFPRFAGDTTTAVRFLSAGETIAPAHGAHQIRVMDSHELLYVSRGTLSLVEDGTRHDLAAGHAFVLLKGTPQGPAEPYPRNLRFFWMHFLIEGSRGRRSPRRPPRRRVGVTRPERVSQLFLHLVDDLDAGRLVQERADVAAAMLLAEVFDERPTGERTGASSSLVVQADRFIRQYSFRSIGAREIATALRCNPDYLGRAYRNAYGRTLTEAIHERRVYEARQLLQRSELNVSEVATACGWDNLGHFRKIFRRHVGMSPSAYRENSAAKRISPRRGRSPTDDVSEYTIPSLERTTRRKSP